VTRVTKIALVPLVALWLWALPRDLPQTEVAGAITVAAEDGGTVEPLADAIEITTTTVATTTSSAEIGAVDESSAAQEPATTIPLTQTQSPTASSGPAPSSTTTNTTTSTGAPPQTSSAPVPIGQQALDRLSFDWATTFPGWRLEFAGPRTGIRALTYPSDRRIEIFVRPDDTPETLHRVFAHELGHVIDVEFNNDEDRARWFEQRNLPEGTPWWPSAEAPDFGTGAGDFAEAFAVMETGVTSRSTVAPQPNAADLALLRELMLG